MKSNFGTVSSDGIRIAFKLPDSSKVEYCFSEAAAVKVSKIVCVCAFVLKVGIC